MNHLPLPRNLLTMGALLLVLALAPFAPAHAQDEGLNLGTQVWITQEYRDGTRLARGFVETQSTSPLVLCAFNENEPGYGGVRLSGLTLMCRQRTVDLGEGDKDGVGILVVLPGTFQPEGDFTLAVTVFQQGAVTYGDLQSCPGEGDC